MSTDQKLTALSEYFKLANIKDNVVLVHGTIECCLEDTASEVHLNNIRALLQGDSHTDLYTFLAAARFNKNILDVTKPERAYIKHLKFADAYGLSEEGLKIALGVEKPLVDIKDVLGHYLSKLEELKAKDKRQALRGRFAGAYTEGLIYLSESVEFIRDILPKLPIDHSAHILTVDISGYREFKSVVSTYEQYLNTSKITTEELHNLYNSEYKIFLLNKDGYNSLLAQIDELLIIDKRNKSLEI